MGALYFSIEFFSVTGECHEIQIKKLHTYLTDFSGKLQEHISCTALPVTWTKPSVGRGVGWMSIYKITNQTAPTYQTDLKYTTEVVNKLINYGINCPLTRCRKLNRLGFGNDHVYCNLNESETGDDVGFIFVHFCCVLFVFADWSSSRTLLMKR